ncbi:MAG: hypothetical protein ACM31D_18765 [Bacteroidota bacterium]
MMHSRDTLDALHKVRAINRVIAERYPEQPLFQTLRECDARHVTALLHLFSLMDWPLPEDRWVGTTFSGNYSALVTQSLQAEADCVRAYDRVLASTSDSTVRTVVGNLRKTSLDVRLPALEKSDAAPSALPPGIGEAMGSARP